MIPYRMLFFSKKKQKTTLYIKVFFNSEVSSLSLICRHIMQNLVIAIHIECEFINSRGSRTLDVDNRLHIPVYHKLYYCNNCFMINY